MCPTLDVPLPAPVGQRVAIEDIVRANAAYVGRALRYLGVRDPELDDACQEVFLVVQRRVGSYEEHGSLRTWLYAICIRVAKSERRKRHARREEPLALLAETPAEANQERELEAKRARDLLTSLLDELDDDKRNVFVLHEIEEIAMQDVSRIVGCPLQTAYSRLHAAREQLAKAHRRRNVGRRP
jgi:RNA polymerase sigma-70 factor (ECF subfamily)